MPIGEIKTVVQKRGYAPTVEKKTVATKGGCAPTVEKKTVAENGGCAPTVEKKAVQCCYLLFLLPRHSDNSSNIFDLRHKIILSDYVAYDKYTALEVETQLDVQNRSRNCTVCSALRRHVVTCLTCLIGQCIPKLAVKAPDASLVERRNLSERVEAPCP